MSLADDVSHIGKDVRKFSGLLLLAIPIIYLLSGFYSVGNEERAIVTRLGKVVKDNVMPGMHYHMPWPMEQIQKIPVTSLRSMEIDFANISNKLLVPELVTGNADLVDVALEVQYTISQVSSYYNSSQDTEAILRHISASETLYYVGHSGFEQILTTGRNRFQNSVKNSLQQKVDHLDLGIRITSVQIKRLDPPKSIKKTFDGVTTARSEKRKLIQEAKGEKATQLAGARSQANKIRLETRSYANDIKKKAEGDRERFLSLLEAYDQSPDVTINRAYLEKVEKLLSHSELVIISPSK